MTGDPLQQWRLIGVVATAVIVLSVPAWVIRRGAEGAGGPEVVGAATFVGREVCLPCHQQAFEKWQGSDHDLAMDVATEETVLGDFDDAVFISKGLTTRFFRRDGKFFVNTEGPDGEMRRLRDRLRLRPRPAAAVPGAVSRRSSAVPDRSPGTPTIGEWFDLYPDQEIPPTDWLHWTRAAQNWNGMCAECHSTNLKKNYDPETRTYDTTWSEIDVSCEACHGPGSQHVAWAEIQPMARPEIDDYGLVVATGGITSARQVELCAPCHSRRGELGDYDHTGAALLDTLQAVHSRGGSLPRRWSDPRRGLCLGLVYSIQDVRQQRQVFGLPRRPQPPAQVRGQRALPPVPPRRRLRHTGAPFPQEGGRAATRRTARCASNATCPSSPTW